MTAGQLFGECSTSAGDGTVGFSSQGIGGRSYYRFAVGNDSLGR
jgi:hypothetical protein